MLSFRRLFLTAMFTVGALGLSGCCSAPKENKTATAACRTSPSSAACKACCNGKGSNSNMFVSGSGCTCY